MNGWPERLAETVDGPGLAPAVRRLLAQQARAWPLLGQGIAALAQSHTKTLAIDGHAVAVRHIPHRMRSTTAPVDAASIGARPCFLCAGQLPREQTGVGFGGDWVVLCNPFPILDRHLTIVHKDHIPQRIEGRFSALLDLASALPELFVIYNGPECGASAPDHLHFQACARALFPIAEAGDDYPSRPVVLRSGARASLEKDLRGLVDDLARHTGRTPEPLLNLAAYWEHGQLSVYVFARRKHRPEAFHAGALLVSPAAIDLCGVLVAPRQSDFTRLDAARVKDLFDEVTLPWRRP